jgi:PAT family beta-lactamase induction signal transducer AmpG
MLRAYVKSLEESRWLRLLVLGALYFAQGVPWGFIGTGYVVLLTDRGLDNASIGDALGLAYVPWSFKILAGPLLDRFPSARFGRRRHFIVAAQAMMALTLLALLPLDASRDLSLVGAVLVAHNAFAALQDVATDALAVDVLPSSERGLANSVMWAAKSAGVALGGGGGTVLAKHLGWPALFATNAAILGIVMLLVVAVRERSAPAPSSETRPVERLEWAELRRAFSFRDPLVGLAIAMIVPIGTSLVGSVMTRMMRADLGFSAEKIALLSGTIDPAAGIVGSLAGGALADRLGLRRVMATTVVLLGAGLLAFAFGRDFWPSYAFLVGWSIVMTLALHAYGSASLGFFMTLSSPRVGATQFATFMAATNLTYAWTRPVGGRLADAHGPVVTFAIAGLVQLASVALLAFVDPARAEARLRGTSANAAPETNVASSIAREAA